MAALNRRQLLKRYCSQQLNAFMINDETQLVLPAQPLLPGSRIPNRVEKYKKEIIALNKQSSISFLTKKHSVTKKYDPHAFVWKTPAKKIKAAVRWGVIATDSVTGRVIANLGRYRLIAHERITKGLISNTHAAKMMLLDLYQDRFELLQPLELLVNKKNTYADYERELSNYLAQLKLLKFSVAEKAKNSGLETLSPGVTKKIERDIDRDIRRAESYLATIKKKAPKLHDFQQATGSKSILTFVKRQMNRNLYEMQGLNQGITFSNTRPAFSATRGEMNDCIVDAMRENDEFNPDLCNGILPAHQGQFGEDDEIISYPFGLNGESPEGQRAAITAISFIESVDQVDLSYPDKPMLRNKYGAVKLKVIASATWQSAVSVKEFFKSLGAAIVNMFKSVAISVRPRESKPWGKDFHLYAGELLKRAKPNHPFWHYPIEVAKQAFDGIKDIFKGVKESGKKLVLDLPLDIVNDWRSTSELPKLQEVIEQVNKKIRETHEQETDALHVLSKEINDNPKLRAKLNKLFDPFTAPKSGPKLAKVDYHLTAGEQNDIITSCFRGTNDFVGLFTHNIFSKDPYAGLIFCATYAFGGLAVMVPSAMAFLGQIYINLSQIIGVSMGSSILGQIISSGSTQAYIAAMLWNTSIEGSRSWIVKLANEFSKEPLQVLGGLAAVYAVGSVMTNGIFGLRIPVLNDFFEEELGTIKELGYLPAGTKVLGTMRHAFSYQHDDPFKGADLSELLADKLPTELLKKYEHEFNKFLLVFWLARNYEAVLKLNNKEKFQIQRQLEHYFSAKDAASLCKIIYPEKERSIAYQLFVIPLSYIPAILRLIVSPILSIFALCCDKPHPAAPMKNASMDLLYKMRRDLLRLFVAGKEIARFVFTVIAATVKLLFNVTMLLVARVAGLCGYHPSHAIHSFMAKVHGFFNRITEKINMGKILKSGNVAHPHHTVTKTALSYSTILKRCPKQADDVVDHASETESMTMDEDSLESAEVSKSPVNDSNIEESVESVSSITSAI